MESRYSLLNGALVRHQEMEGSTWVKLGLGLHFSRNIILVMQTGPSVTSQNLVPHSERRRLHMVIGR